MVKFVQMTRSNLSEKIAEQMENMILTQELKVGDRLPGEIELAEQFGSSRNILREALNMLKERGLIEVKPGSGAYVAQPSPFALGDMVHRMVTLGSVPPYEIYEVRMALEVRACGLAAVNSDREGVDKLHALIKKMEKDYADNRLWAQYEFKFHIQIAEMTRTNMFPIFLRPLINLVFNITKENPRPMDARISGLDAHKKIVDAIASKNRSSAEKAMAEHLQGFLNDLLKEKEELEQNL